MTKQTSLYTRYLSNYFGRLGDVQRVRERKLASLRANYLSLLPQQKDAHILEIGPGHGEFLEFLQQLGYQNVRAVDLSAEVVEHCNQLWPGTALVTTDTVSFLNENQETFDLILLLHVLEHVPKPQVIPLLEAIHNALVTDGKLIVEVPNMANPVTGLYTRYADFTHEVGFVDTSLAFVLKEAGFAQIDLHELKLPMDRWYRLLQIAFGLLFAQLFKLLQFLLAIRSTARIAHAIFAYATK